MTRMINNKILSGVTLFILLTIFSVLYKTREQKYHIDLFKSGQGWGYDITLQKKLFIHQPFMPVIKGQVAFTDRKSARKTADLVVKKLRNKVSPGISIDELKAIVKF
jgi:hypothetical protein